MLFNNQQSNHMTPIQKFEQLFLESIKGVVDDNTLSLIERKLYRARIDLVVWQNDELMKELKKKESELFPKDEVVHASEDLEVESSGHLKG